MAKSKIKSRKLFVFVMWTILGVVLLITKNSIDTFIPYYGMISGIYIGGQSAIDYMEKKKDNK